MAEKYNPRLHTSFNKAIAVQGLPLDARCMYYTGDGVDPFRPYVNEAEAREYLYTARIRKGGFIIVMEAGLFYFDKADVLRPAFDGILAGDFERYKGLTNVLIQSKADNSEFSAFRLSINTRVGNTEQSITANTDDVRALKTSMSGVAVSIQNLELIKANLTDLQALEAANEQDHEFIRLKIQALENALTNTTNEMVNNYVPNGRFDYLEDHFLDLIDDMNESSVARDKALEHQLGIFGDMVEDMITKAAVNLLLSDLKADIGEDTDKLAADIAVLKKQIELLPIGDFASKGEVAKVNADSITRDEALTYNLNAFKAEMALALENLHTENFATLGDLMLVDQESRRRDGEVEQIAKGLIKVQQERVDELERLSLGYASVLALNALETSLKFQIEALKAETDAKILQDRERLDILERLTKNMVSQGQIEDLSDELKILIQYNADLINAEKLFRINEIARVENILAAKADKLNTQDALNKLQVSSNQNELAIKAEILNRIDGDQKLRVHNDAEIAARKQADENLLAFAKTRAAQGSLDKEIFDRTRGDEDIMQHLAAEAALRKAGDEDLRWLIDQLIAAGGGGGGGGVVDVKLKTINNITLKGDGNMLLSKDSFTYITQGSGGIRLTD